MNTNSNNTNTKIKENDVDWKELEGIGIHKSELEQNGDLDRLLNGEQVSIISLQLTLLGIDIELDATIQIIEENNVPMLEICSIAPPNSSPEEVTESLLPAK